MTSQFYRCAECDFTHIARPGKCQGCGSRKVRKMTEKQLVAAISALPQAVDTGLVAAGIEGERPLLRCSACGETQMLEEMESGGAYDYCAFCAACGSELRL